MSKPSSSRRYTELLSGEMVVIMVGFEENKTPFYVHQNLLNSVTEVYAASSYHVNSSLKEEIKRIEFPKMDAKIFKMFLSWLYNNDRAQELKTKCYTINSLMCLYDLSISVKCDALKPDTLSALLVILNKSANSFVENVDSMLSFKKYTECSNKVISRLHTMLNEISELTKMELGDIGSLRARPQKTVFLASTCPH